MHTDGSGNIGKSVRLERIFNRRTGNTIIIPMDHGVGAGPIKGLIDLSDMVNDSIQADDPTDLVNKISKIIHQGYSVDEVYE